MNSLLNLDSFISFKKSSVNYQLTVNCNYPCPPGLIFHIFPSISSSAKSLHIEQFQPIVFIFSQRSNPNRRFHLFSYRESVFSGIFSGTGIVWKGDSFCTPPPLLSLLFPVCKVSIGVRPCLIFLLWF